MNPPAAGTSSTHKTADVHQEKHVGWEDQEAEDRRKRRRTNSYNADGNGINDAGAISQSATEVMTQVQDPVPRSGSPHVCIPGPDQVDTKPESATELSAMQPSATPQKKMMKLNAGGKLSSPGGERKADANTLDVEPRRRGRPRKAKEPEPPKTRVVIFRYGYERDAEKRTLTGQRLQRILDGDERIPEPASTQKRPKTTRKTKPAKPTHPFFNGKPDEKPAIKLLSPHKASASTPGKLRSHALQDRTFDASKEVPYAVGSALLKDRLMTRHPGAREPLWPDKSQAHVRGLDDVQMPCRSSYSADKKKRKQFRQPMVLDTTVLDEFAAQLKPEQEPEQRPDGFASPRYDLRLPTKLLISGSEVLDRVSGELKAAIQYMEGPKQMDSTVSLHNLHSAVQKLCRALPHQLSAFDHCIGETQSWTQKYAPTAAQEVLQPSGEMAILKDWLLSLKVNTVEAAPATQPATKVSSKPKKKRRRKNEDMDDFVVDDEMIAYDMDTGPETIESDEPQRGSQPKSFVQASNGSRVSNAVLMSGPHGCGKTASAYAVAKELGYQIFEISSAERRSGRDVVDRVGDMTENHIVRHHGIDLGEMSASEDNSHIDTAFQKDLESGRQGKMSAFFKKQPDAKPAASKASTPKVQTVEKLQKALKQPTKDQQQSLILLEEVDVLFKEDKEFWTTVFKLLATSKRPFIMTCNDEDLVPLQAMNLHAILRMNAPSADSAIDLMLTIAAMEGHLLKREAVGSLFDSKKHDLRASIAELDFWCQMGVGDPKNGLNWIYQRYPPGSDVDEHGRKLRLISEGTFQVGMGLVQSGSSVNDDAMLSAWREFGVDPAAVMGWIDAPRQDLQHEMLTTLPSSLHDFSRMAESLSAIDAYTTHNTMDASLPEMPTKARSHYIEGMALLESNEGIDHDHMSARLAITSTRLAHSVWSSGDHGSSALAPSKIWHRIREGINSTEPHLVRRDFVCFDAISTPVSGSTSSGLEQSAFDGPLKPIAIDLAPYVRSIAQYDLSLEKQRAKLGEITGDLHQAKRARTTRAARSALEGSQRGNTRRERWFNEYLDLKAVLATGGPGWPKTTADMRDETREGSEQPASSMGSVASVSPEQRLAADM